MPLKINPSHRIVRFIKDPLHGLISDVIPVTTATYFVFKKLSNFYLEDVLDTIMRPTGVNYIIGLGLAVVFYSSLIKISIMVIDKYSIVTPTTTDFSSFLHLYKKNNNEIEAHIAAIQASSFNKDVFASFQPYDKNIHLLIYAMHEHIRYYLGDAKIKSRDICISFYERADETMPTNSMNYKLLTCYDQRFHEIKTVNLSLGDPTSNNFAGIKAIRAGARLCLSKCSGSDYVKGTTRRKSVKQYIAIPLEACNEIDGLINIEFHNKDFFASNNQMDEFYSDHLYGFKCLFEYQLLKRRFFNQLSGRIL